MSNEIQQFIIASNNGLSKKRAKSTVYRYLQSLKHFIKITGITTLLELQKLTTIERFVETKKAENISNEAIARTIEHISAIISYWEKRQKFEPASFFFERNPFAYYLRENIPNRKIKHHKVRTREEIAVWIEFLPSSQRKALWFLYSIGLRLSEAKEIKVKQIDLEKRIMYNILRKGNRNHAQIGLPSWIIPILADYIKDLSPNDKIYEKTVRNIHICARAHFTRLISIQEKLSKKQNLTPYWQRVNSSILILKENGHITPHQLRTTWDTLSAFMGMKDVYRRYHLNHKLQGMDDTYIQISKNDRVFNDYLNELDTKSPNFLF